MNNSKRACNLKTIESSYKGGRHVIQWLSVIVLSVVIVGIVWFFVGRKINSTADEVSHGVEEDTALIFKSAETNTSLVDMDDDDLDKDDK